MDYKNNWSQWRRRLLDLVAAEPTQAVGVLKLRYAGEMQGVERFTQYADKMNPSTVPR